MIDNAKSILNQMYLKNREFEKMNLAIKECQMLRKATIFKVSGASEVSILPGLHNAKSIEDILIEPDEELRERIVSEIENYYKECIEKCNLEIEELLETLKSL